MLQVIVTTITRKNEKRKEITLVKIVKREFMTRLIKHRTNTDTHTHTHLKSNSIRSQDKIVLHKKKNNRVRIYSLLIYEKTIDNSNDILQMRN